MNRKNVWKRMGTMLLVVLMLVSTCSGALAASVVNATIDTKQAVSLTLFKYDMTSATKDGTWSMDSYVSTGIYDEDVNQALASYAIKGVVFSYLKVADIKTSKSEAETYATGYAFPVKTTEEKHKTLQLLDILGLAESDAMSQDTDSLCFQSDVLIKALRQALEASPTEVKSALEEMMDTYEGTAMKETDSNGRAKAENLEQGLYLLVETQVPENVVDTTDPFFVSLPMTTLDGDAWNYDVTVYPKNETGAPDLTKTVREAAADTGKNECTKNAEDGYAHDATASEGDQVEYRIQSTLPVITSKATSLRAYTFLDTLSKGLTYDDASQNGEHLTISWYQDTDCQTLVTEWTKDSGKFQVSYSDYSAYNGSTMEIKMTEAGLKEINNSTLVYGKDSKYRGFSELTMVINYTATLNKDVTVVLGDNGNPNEVTLTWKRTNTSYYDQLKDDCHVYTYGLDLTKEFSDDLGNFSNVDFLIYNAEDGYYLQAEEDSGVYYVSGHADEESEATIFHPQTEGDYKGKLLIRGLEDDTYVITETHTDKGYSLLKEDITLVIATEASSTLCETCETPFLTASATVNGETVTMTEENSSAHAIAALTVINTKGFTLPKTGGQGVLIMVAISIMCAAVGIWLCITRRKSHGR